MTAAGNILAVDDNPANLRMLQRILTKVGYEVRATTDGKEALAAARATRPDLILLDVSMPVMDGFELCGRLKEIDGLDDVPIIFISALDDAVGKVKAFDLGAADYIIKPFHHAEVTARVQVHIQLARAQREQEAQNQRLQATLDDLRAAEAQLIQAEKMASVGLLVSGIAHEINNPVNAVNASARALQKLVADIPDGVSGDLRDGILELSTTILSGAQRTAAIVRGLLTYSHERDGSKMPADLNAGIDATLALLEHRISTKIVVVKNYGDLPSVLCDAGQINQVMMNLLVNAIDAIEGKPEQAPEERITITTRQINREAAAHVVIEVADTGPGMPPEVERRIFEPFFTTKPVGQGTGLGLSISANIVARHGGTLTALNGPDRGATVTVLLPVGYDRSAGGGT